MDAVTIIATLLFAFSGDVTADYCGAVAEDSCLETSSCDVFIAADANESSVCKTACDARTTETSCGLDSACAWSAGTCDYQVEDDVIGC